MLVRNMVAVVGRLRGGFNIIGGWSRVEAEMTGREGELEEVGGCVYFYVIIGEVILKSEEGSEQLLRLENNCSRLVADNLDGKQLVFMCNGFSTLLLLLPLLYLSFQ